MTRTRPVVAIDGPAGAGKTTVTRKVAAELGYLLVDTGAIYRSVALAAKRQGLDFADADAVGRLAQGLAAREGIRFASHAGGGQRVLLDDDDVSTAIRTQEIAEGASRVSAIPAVRAALLDMQRRAGLPGGVVLEGRDIGSVVFPDAEAKFFLTASVEVRAVRRKAELEARGEPADLEVIAREVRDRDHRDSTRPVAPLTQAPDAILVDSSALDIDAVVGRIVAHVREVERRLASPA
ncbi:MAG: (d)CMP kinase [Polyangiaceae bacterium]|jgi:cytidylate kinase|nr:(d)CMP kinase [Polyangiaceae bacterium]